MTMPDVQEHTACPVPYQLCGSLLSQPQLLKNVQPVTIFVLLASMVLTSAKGLENNTCQVGQTDQIFHFFPNSLISTIFIDIS